MDTDAIVNAANTALSPGGGVCGAIFAAAGYDRLEKACRKIGHCDTGKAVITKGYALKAKYIIHTPGPIYNAARSDNAELLYSCYRSSLELARKHRLASIAFPLISSGIYGYPAQEALSVAQSAIKDFLKDNEMDISLVVYDKNSFKVSRELFDEVREYIDQRLVREQEPLSRRSDAHLIGRLFEGSRFDADREHNDAPMRNFAPGASSDRATKRKFAAAAAAPSAKEPSLEDMLRKMDSSFSEHLLYLIDESGMTDVQVFSKIRSKKDYKPKKTTAVALGLALELDMDGMRSLVSRAGYSFSHSSKFDIIIEYYVMRGNYNIFDINDMLFAFDQPLVG